LIRVLAISENILPDLTMEFLFYDLHLLIQ